MDITTDMRTDLVCYKLWNRRDGGGNVVLTPAEAEAIAERLMRAEGDRLTVDRALQAIESTITACNERIAR